jgi:hypothetical protein
MLRLNLELKPLPKPPANTLYLKQHKEAEAARGVASLSRDTLPREAKEVAVCVCVRVLVCPLSL